MEGLRAMAVHRCGWASNDLLARYHDEEWGVPVHDDRRLFEMLTLEGAQAGLSWQTILQRREGYRRAFAGFDPAAVAQFDAGRIEALVADPGIIRHRGKIEATITNARAFLRVQAEFGSFDAYLWRFVGGESKRNAWSSMQEIPATTPESDALSKDLKRRGFKFVGSTICYAFMQAAGLVNDHITGCFRYGADTPPGHMEIAPAAMADVPAILALFDDAVVWLGSKGIPGQWGTDPFSTRPGVEGRFRAWIESGALFTARIAGELVGVLAAGEKVPGYATPQVEGRPGPAYYLEAFTTKREYEGRGIGRALLGWAERFALAQGVTCLRLDCWAGNPALCAYYERAGYVPFGECHLGNWRGRLFAKWLAVAGGQ